MSSCFRETVFQGTIETQQSAGVPASCTEKGGVGRAAAGTVRRVRFGHQVWSEFQKVQHPEVEDTGLSQFPGTQGTLVGRHCQRGVAAFTD